MNRNYKVIWNRSLGCFTAVAEYAKSRGKSSNTAVTSGVSSTTATTRLLRLSTLCLGLAISGVGVQTIAAVNYQGDIGDNINALGTLNVNGGVTDIAKLSDSNIGVISDSNPANNIFGVKTLTIKLAKNINLSADGSVRTGSSVMDDDGVSIAGGAKFTKSGIDAGNQKISGVVDGAVDTSSTEAVNGRQLNATNQALAAQKIKYFSVKSTGGGNENNDGATGADAIAIGKDASSSGLAAIGLGLNAEASGSKSLALGQNAIASGGQSIAIGGVQDNAATPRTTASGQQSIAIGANVVSSGASSIAMGGDDLDAASQANVDGSTPSSTLNGGTVNKVFRSYAKRDLLDTSQQYAGYTQAAGDASIAIGAKSRSEGALSTAIGVHSSTAGVAASAFGVAASASKDGSVALGAGSLTENDATSEKSVVINGETYTFAGNVLDDNNTIKTGAQLSVGSVGAERQIKNVAGGAISASSTDGVNGSQLFATNASIDDLSDTVAAQKIKYFSVKSTGGGNENNDGATGADAIAIGKDASATGLRAVSLGFGAKATAKDATAIGPNAQASSPRSISLGDLAGNQSTSSQNSSNIAIGGSGDKSVTGFGAGSKVVGRDNIALGAESGSEIDGKINVGIGAEAGNFVKGDINLGLGLKAGNQVEGSRNAAVGAQAGRSVTGNFNSAFGNLAGQGVTGNSNSAIGDSSGSGVTGEQNVAMGFEAGQNITADGTVAIGARAIASTNNAIAIGKDASTTGLRAVSLGFGAAATGEDATAIGPQAQALSNRSISIGNLSGSKSSAPGNKSNIAIGGSGDKSVNGFGAGSQVVGRDNIALGTESASIVRGRSNIGIGSETGNNVKGSFNSALGFKAGSTVDGDQNVAIGFEAGQKVTTNRTVSIGARAKASADESIAIGTNAKASGLSSVSIGTGNSVAADNALAIGNNVSIAKGLDGAVGIGNNSAVTASTVASFIPTGATSVVGTSTGSNVVSVGSAGNERRLTNVAAGGADTDAVNVSQLRSLSSTVAAQKIKYFSVKSTGGGNENNDGATGTDAIAIGKDASTTGLRAVSLGFGAAATGEDATAIGPQAQALSNRSISIGNLSGSKSSAPGNKSNIAIGGSGDKSVNGFGAGSQVVGRDNIALGTESASIVRGRSNIGIGSETGNNVKGSFNSALGFKAGSTVDGDQNVAIGFEAGQKVTTNRTVSIGARAKASADESIAIGTNAKASGLSSVSIGTGNSVAADNALAIGNNVSIAKGLDGAVGIGNNSAVTASTVASFIPTGATSVVGTSTGSNVVSVGSVGNERRLTNVAAGGADTDAVNVSQLSAVDKQVATNTGSINKGINFNVNNKLKKTFALGEEIKFNTDANLTTTALGSNDGITLGLANTINVGAPTDNPITINGSVGTVSGLTNQSFDPSNFISGQAATEDQLKSVSDVANAGWGITVGQNGGTTFNGGTTNIGPGDRVAIDSGKNINFLVDSTEGVPTLTVSTKDEVEFTQVTIGDTSGDNTVLTSGANGLDVGGDKLTSVGVGAVEAGSTDAINGSQLFDTNQNVIGNTTALGGSYDADTDIYTPPSYVLDDGTNSGTNAPAFNNVGSALGNLDGRTISNTANIAKGINFNVNNKLKKTFALGEEIKFNTDANLTTTALGSADGITLKLADTINVGGTKASAVKINGNTGTVSNLSNTTFDAGATYTGGVAATQEQLSQLSGSVTTLGFGIKAADGKTVQKNLGEAVEVIGSNANITTQENEGKVEVVLSDTLDLGSKGSVTTGNTLLNDSGVTLKGGSNQVVRLTNNGLDNGNNKISNVAAGDIAAGSTEVVNGSQLYNAANALTNVMGGSTVNNGGIITTSNIGDTGKDNIHDAIKSVNTAAVQAKTTVEQGKNITVTQDKNQDGSTKYIVATADNLDVTSVKAGNTSLSTNGVTVDDGKGNSTTLTTAGSTVTNAEGSTSYGANGLSASDNKGNSTVINQDGLSFTGNDGSTGPSVTASGIDAGSTQITNVASGGIVGTNAANINDVRTAVASAKPVFVNGTNIAPVVKTLSADGQDTYVIHADGASASAGSTAMTVTAGLKDDNNITNYAVDLSDITKASLVRADSAMQSLVTQIDGKNVKTVNQSSNTANFVTGDNIVLSDDNGSIKVATSQNLKVTSVTANTLTAGNTTVNNNGLSIVNGPSITADQGINAGGQTVTGVADGIAPKDAVNVGQLRAVESNFGSAFNELGYRIDDVEKESRAGIAATLALESAPYVPGKFTYAVGAGFHRGENAVGASLRHTAVSGRWSLTGGVAADSEGGASVRVGVSGVIN